MNLKLTIGIAAGTLTAIAATPQIFKAIKTKKVEHVSPLMFIILMAGNGLWCWYGIVLQDWPIIITNSFSLAMDLTMLFLKGRYSKNSSNNAI